MSRKPEVEVSANIVSQVNECSYENVEFAKRQIYVEYSLGSDDLVVELPELQFTPDCGLDISIVNASVEAQELPSAFSVDSLVKFDQDKLELTVLKQTNLALFNKQITGQITVLTSQGLSASLGFGARYKSSGPWLEGEAQVQNITCSQQDRGWSFQLPKIGASDL